MQNNYCNGKQIAREKIESIMRHWAESMSDNRPIELCKERVEKMEDVTEWPTQM